MRKAIAILMLLLAGCAQTPALHRGDVENALRARSPQIEETAAATRAARSLPARLAVSQPLSGRAWSAAEIAEITNWERPLALAGIARQIVVLPPGMLDDCTTLADGSASCPLESQRQAAVIYGADELLVMNPETRVDERANFLAPLDFTLVGLLIIPAHQRQGLTLVEATLIDSRNQRVQAVARGEGWERTARPWVYADASETEERSRLLALRHLGRELAEAARRP